MSRKSLIFCLSAMAVLLIGLGVAIAFLYSGTGSGTGGERNQVTFSDDRKCLTAVPSDAVLVSYFDDMGAACKGVLSHFDFPSSLVEKMADGSMSSLKKCSMAVSLHYAGKVHGLYLIDLDRASDVAVVELEAVVERAGMYSSRIEDIIAISASETLVRSSVRHFEKKVSVADATGFTDALGAVDGRDVLLVSNLHAQKLMQSVFSGSALHLASFVERTADWMVFNVSSDQRLPFSLDGIMLYEGEPDEFLTVLEDCRPSVSEVAKVLPSYTLSALSLPIRNIQEYITAYQSFLDSRQGLQDFKARQKSLGKSAGIMPEELFLQLDIRELASATFMVNSKRETINLIRTGCRDADSILKGNEWAYPSFVASVFGKQFSLPDESSAVYVDGWIITGSQDAVNEYVENRVLEYTLEEYMSDAGKASLLSERPVLALAYFSLNEDMERLSSCLKPVMLKALQFAGECDYVPAVFALTKDKRGLQASFNVYELSLQKTKALSYDRDTVVTVPAGPFQVRNSHTGKMNTFYQNSQKSICLRDENGKDLWGVPFGKSLCGTAHNVDYYANGKLQIIFGAGSSVYVIDRLGRYVTGFPLDLGKEIVLGPDVYDFSGARRYNIMVLHKDNTVQMYNLKGKKPQAWKGITAEETIKALPERLTVGGKDFWIVRTSVQTLIFPFYGGDSLTVFEGNGKIRPDSEVTVVDDTSVQVVNYDGKTKTIRLI